VTADQLERESREHDDEINIQRPGDCPFGLNVAFYPLEAAGIMSGNNRMGAPAVVLSWSERLLWFGYHGFGSAQRASAFVQVFGRRQ